MATKLTVAQIKAQKKWEADNKDKRAYIRDKSACKSFIKNKATIEDLEDIIQLAQDIKKEKNI